MMLTERNEGIYANIPIEDYHKDIGISNSGISLILDAPKKYWSKYIDPERTEDEEKTQALILGSAIHCLVLEPELFDKQFVVAPKVDRRTTEGKKTWADFLCYVQSKSFNKSLKFCPESKIYVAQPKPTILRVEAYIKAQKMAQSIRGNKAFMAFARMGGKVEHSAYWKDYSGSWLRSRPDFYNDQFILDIKTTRSAKEKDFQRSIETYGYHRQAAMALDGLEKLTGISGRKFVLLAIESSEPFLTSSYLINSESIEIGRAEYKKGAIAYYNCIQSGVWNGYSEAITDLGLSDWYITK